MRRILAGLAAAVGLAALLVAAPWALAMWGRPALLWRIDWRHLATAPDDGRLMLGLLSVVGWVAWFVLAVSVVVEVAESLDRVLAVRRQRPHRPVLLPGLDLPRLLVRGLVVTALTAFLGMGSARAASAAVLPSVVASAPMDLPRSAAGDASTALSGVNVSTAENLQERSSAEGTSVVVVRGDSLWKLAALHLGGGQRWPEIFALNRDLIEDPDLILPGWRLRLPASAVRLPASAAQAPGAVGAAVNSEVPPAPEAFPRAAPAETAPVPAKAPVATTPVVPAGSVPGDHPSSGSPAAVASAATTRPDGLDAADQTDDARSLSASQALALGVIGTVGAGFAAGLVRTVRRRRDVQLALRPPGRRIRFPSDSIRVVESALTLAGLPSLPERLRVAPLTQGTSDGERTLGDEDAAVVRAPNDPVAHAGQALPQGGPAGGLSGAGPYEPRHAVPNTAWAMVTAGLTVAGPLDVDLESHGIVAVDLDDEEAAWGTACAWGLELACGASCTGTDWPGAARVVVAGPYAQALAAAQLDSILSMPTTTAAVDDLVATAARQREELVAAGWSLREARLDTDARDAWWPTVYLLGGLDEASAWRVGEAVHAKPRTAVSVILVDSKPSVGSGTMAARLVGSAESAVLEPQGVRLRPVSLSALGATGVVELLQTAASDETDPAPWYATDDAPQPDGGAGRAHDEGVDPTTNEPGNVLPLLPRHPESMKEAVDVGDDSPGVTDFCHPTLMLLGPIKLLGAAGPPPARAERSCIEYCTWMVEHPGATASQMAASLLVAEGTRRSNVSRLRGWLGTGEDGVPYLPEAYTGRLYLDPLVSSDWQRMQALVSQGVNRVPVATLVSALKLVRGAPLANAAPGQWHWAEELRIDMVSTIRDIAARLGEIALEDGDLDLARWAAGRGLVAAPGDEILMRLRLRTEHRAGNRPEVERIVLHLTRHARVLGIDLDDETVEAIQEAIEGRLRARA